MDFKEQEKKCIVDLMICLEKVSVLVDLVIEFTNNEFIKGIMVDAKDRNDNWYTAIILYMIDVDSFRVRYIGWKIKFNEDVLISSLKSFGTYTNKKFHVGEWAYVLKKSSDLKPGYIVSKEFRYVGEMRAIIESSEYDMENKSESYIVRGKVTNVTNEFVTIEHENGTTIVSIKQLYGLWCVIKTHIDWTCPGCGNFWKGIIYFCHLCGFTH